ncbi:hypothetical protein WJX74_005382 [Apatococcus lobatus]|uniref:YLP motif-containing protein 1 n=1 Tax=Apatococcus lobatus TaxID=904363 RepID=A0AAW1QIU5_9CHLO
MEYSGYWQANSAPAESEPTQGQWSSGENAWGKWPQSGDAGQSSQSGDWPLAQPGASTQEHIKFTGQGTEGSSHELPPLPPGGPANDTADQPPPLPDGPPPLPSDAPPPLPPEIAPSVASAELEVATAGSSYELPGQLQPDLAVAQAGPDDQLHAQPELPALANASPALAYASQQEHQCHADDSAEARYNDWQASHYQQPSSSLPEQPNGYASTYHYSQESWQAPQYAHSVAYAEQQHYQQYYQQPTQQHPWQLPTPWQSTTIASSQYAAPALYAAAGQYPSPDVSQQTYPHYQTPTYLPASNDPSSAAGSYQAEAAPVMPAASAAGLSGPPQTPIVVVHATDLFEMPGCAKRPKKIAILLRGIPGSGKTHIAQQLRKMELKITGDAPRIHSIDDYFMTEVEREEEDVESGKRGKKRKVQELEYCYEQEMEGSYRRSLLKAYQKTMDEKRFNIVIVDAPNLLVEDFKPYWSAGQRAGYEVYILDPFEGDPETCFKRNVHDRSLEDIQGAAACWEPAPAFYPRLDVTSLFAPSSSRQPKPSRIMEVEMDAEADAAPSSAPARQRSRWAVDDDEFNTEDQQTQQASSKRSKAGKESTRSDAKQEDGTSKEVFDGLTDGLDGLIDPQSGKGKSGPAAHATSSKAGSSVSALSKRPGKKSVRWADQAEKSEGGFSIGGTAALQLETVYVLSGLGPPQADRHDQKGSFAAKARAERSSEHSFKDMMLGNKQK